MSLLFILSASFVTFTLGDVFGGVTVTISSQNTEFIGNIRDAIDDEGYEVYEFLGVPYASPPLDDLRFAPANYTAPEADYTYNNTRPKCACMQPIGKSLLLDGVNLTFTEVCDVMDGTTYESEDCLYLDIYAPSGTTSSSSLPVLVWIYGGAFQFGDINSAEYEGRDTVSRQGNFILVEVNYRLGIFGFLQAGDLKKKDNSQGANGGLNGIRDQLTGLQWIYNNIEYFGGNPDDISIFGESAGGLSVCTIILTPVLEDFLPKSSLNRAIIQSGACDGPWGATYKKVGHYLSELYCDAAWKVSDCNKAIKKMEDQTGREIQIQMKDATGIPVLKELLGAGIFMPSVDGYILDEAPRTTFSHHNKLNDNGINVDSLIMGANSQDGLDALLNTTLPTTNSQFKDKISAIYSDSTADEVVDTYYNINTPLYDGSYKHAFYSLDGDVCLVCPTVWMLRKMANMDSPPTTRMYFFEGPPNYWADHATDVPYVFYDDTSLPLSCAMSSAWANFAVSGDPNLQPAMMPNVSSCEVYNATWNVYTADEPNAIQFRTGNVTNRPYFGTAYKNDVCGFWEDKWGDTFENYIHYTQLCLGIELADANIIKSSSVISILLSVFVLYFVY